MPDWFYRTIARPVLFSLPARRAQQLACRILGTIGNLPYGAGGAFIDFLGHMRPEPGLERLLLGRIFIGPVGLGTRLDGQALATKAWSRFGFSFLELGPVSSTARSEQHLRWDVVRESILVDSPSIISGADLSAKLENWDSSKVHLIVRLKIEDFVSPVRAAAEVMQLSRPLKHKTPIFSLDLTATSHPQRWSPDEWQIFWGSLDHDQTDPYVWLLVLSISNRMIPLENGIRGSGGIILDACDPLDDSTAFGPGSKRNLIEIVKSIRASADSEITIIASGGIHHPADAAEVLEAGADLLQVDSGLVYSGPGLPKRVNCALRGQGGPGASSLPESPQENRFVRQSWFWSAAMGAGMLLGSIIALWMAATRVVMPYDETFCGIDRAQLEQINPRLLPFMAHDRVTLAGTMIAIGILYLSFSWFGSRRGEHWAKVAVNVSAGAGFFSFFLFLGFDYFDPFHGFVTAVLFQLFIQSIIGGIPERSHQLKTDWRESAEWRRAQWGQLLLIIHSVGLLAAGIVICSIGIGDVFVNADLKYLQTELAILEEANPRLIPLVAHDRATLGGMLISTGLIYLLACLWGMERGAKWLWHSFLWSGLAAYFCAIAVHFSVGYIDWRHLLPAFAGLGLFLAALALCRDWIAGESHSCDQSSRSD